MVVSATTEISTAQIPLTALELKLRVEKILGIRQGDRLPGSGTFAKAEHDHP